MKLSQEAEELLQERIVLIEGAIDDETSTVVIAQMLFLQWEDAREPLTLRIDSPGGSVTAGMAVADTVIQLSPPVGTECRRQAGGMAGIILASGSKGRRFVGERAELSLGRVESDKAAADDIRLKRTQRQLAEFIAKLCGQPMSVVEDIVHSGRVFTPQEAVEFGLADQIGL